ncbi:MAG: hypothetical protein ACOYLV_16170, partial [Rubrivivax sp.]
MHPLLAAMAGVAFLAACTTPPSPPAPRTFAGVTVAAPLPPQPVSDRFHGVTVVDSWRYTENVGDPTVAAWMKGQAEATQQILARLPGRQALLARVREIDAAAA